MPENPVKINNYLCGRQQPLLFITGPCVIENEEIVFEIADQLAQIKEELNLQLVFKAS